MERRKIYYNSHVIENTRIIYQSSVGLNWKKKDPKSSLLLEEEVYLCF